jgi:hypothetical protein
MKTHSPNATRRTQAVGDVTIAKDVASAPKDQGEKRLEAPCVMPISLSAFRC